MKLPLTAAQSATLIKFRAEFASKIGYNIKDPVVWFRRHIANYLSTLSLAGEIQNHVRRGGALIKKTQKGRQESLRAFHNYFERDATADDIIREIAKFIPVPPFAANVIREDFELLATERSKTPR